MPTDPRYLPPLEMPPPAAPVPVDVLVDAPLAPPVPAPDYELVATMGRQLSEPVAQMQSIVQALLDTGKISRRKVQMLLGELAAIRRLSMQGQFIKVTDATLTYVAIDEEGHPRKVPPLPAQ